MEISLLVWGLLHNSRTMAPLMKGSDCGELWHTHTHTSHQSLANPPQTESYLSNGAAMPFVRGVPHDAALWITSATVIATMNSFSYHLQSVQCVWIWVTIGNSRYLGYDRAAFEFVFRDCDLFINQSTQPLHVMFPNYLFLFTQLH